MYGLLVLLLTCLLVNVVWVALVQVKQDELIQFAQNAITGLKINAEMLRWLNEDIHVPFTLVSVYE